MSRVDSAEPYLLRIRTATVQETEDPYSLGPLLGDIDLHLFNEGQHQKRAEHLGAGVATIDGVRGVRFSVWAPNARAVSIVGDFNTWDPRRNAMQLRYPSGVLRNCSSPVWQRALDTNLPSSGPTAGACR